MIKTNYISYNLNYKISTLSANPLLKRIEEKVDIFTGSTQAGYKCGRSCCDLVWAERMLISVVTRKHFEYHKMGIDMSRAFDTIKRHGPFLISLLKPDVQMTISDWSDSS